MTGDASDAMDDKQRKESILLTHIKEKISYQDVLAANCHYVYVG